MFQTTSFRMWSALCVVVFCLTGCAALADKWANEEREIVQRQLNALEEIDSKASRKEEAGSREKASPEGVTNPGKVTGRKQQASERQNLTDADKPKTQDQK